MNILVTGGKVAQKSYTKSLLRVQFSKTLTRDDLTFDNIAENGACTNAMNTAQSLVN